MNKQDMELILEGNKKHIAKDEVKGNCCVCGEETI
jgi:hypothetical protein